PARRRPHHADRAGAERRRSAGPLRVRQKGRRRRRRRHGTRRRRPRPAAGPATFAAAGTRPDAAAPDQQGEAPMTLARAPLCPLLALSLLFAPPPAGARTLDRRTAIRIAAQQNPQVAAARADEEVVRALGRQADAARWPMVTLTAAVGPALQATLVPGTADQSVEKQYSDLHVSDLSIGLFGDLTVI